MKPAAAGFGLLVALTVARELPAQADSARARRERADTSVVQGGIYNRPYIVSSGRTAIGGYVEANSNYFVEDGVGEGFSAELRRFNIFLYAALGSRIRFTSELEFEHGAAEINLETALVDFIITPSLVLRAGIVLPPIGGFNQNHDGPRWDFVDRPLVSTQIIPATLSEAGFGAYGRLYPGGVTVTYDAYLTNGLGDGIILNETGRTFLPAGKGETLVAGDNNGRPAFSSRVAVHRGGLGEIGLSAYTGTYNTFTVAGERVDKPRSVTMAAVDANLLIGPVSIRGEAALARIDVPPDLAEVFGDRQWGFHLDVVVPVWRPRIRGLIDPKLAAGLRVERIDYNVGRFRSTGGTIGDDVNAVTLALAFRPVPAAVVKLNYRYEWARDLAANEAVRRAGFQVGVATYF